MKHVLVDFNTLNSKPVDLVKLAAPGTPQEARLPALDPGERVILYDSDGLEVEAIVIRDDEGWWMAAPDAATWRDAMPEQTSAPSTQVPS